MNKMLADVLMVLSLISLILAAYGSFVSDLWLASSQWLLIAILLSIYGIYAKER